MRPTLLAAVLLTFACASSSPEPASAPTPASDSAALARTAPRAAITAREQYYDIDGSSAGALRDQIRRLGPKDESGKSHDALTVWNLEWTYGTAQRGDSCALRDVKVTLDVSVTLPRWTPPSTATRQLTDTWRTYLRNVKLHESGHRALAEASESIASLVAVVLIHGPTSSGGVRHYRMTPARSAQLWWARNASLLGTSFGGCRTVEGCAKLRRCNIAGPSSNGRTPDFGSGYGGSNPPGPTSRYDRPAHPT